MQEHERSADTGTEPGGQRDARRGGARPAGSPGPPDGPRPTAVGPSSTRVFGARSAAAAGAGPLEPDDPASIGSYLLVGRLGSGGMGTVYLGRSLDDRLVAVKVIRAEPGAGDVFRARFRDEVENARRVASFCTAQVLDHGEADGRPYLVTEYVDGISLEDHIAAHGALPPGTLHGVAVGVAAALTAIHSTGLVHRDLKPSNVLLSLTGPRVIDFGIARALDATSQHTRTGFVVGSLGWMAPEQVLGGEIGTAADVFTWGCLIARAGTGRHPYGQGDLMVLARRIAEEPPDLAGLPEELRRLVARALSADPTRRPSARQLLLSLVGGEDLSVDAQAAAGQELGKTWVADALAPGLLGSAVPGAGPPIVPGRPSLSGRPSQPALQPPMTTQPPISARQPYAGPPGYAGGQASTPTPYARPGPRRRHRGCLGCLIALLVVAAIGVAGLAVLAAITQPAKGRLRQPAGDGQFVFVVSNVRCGADIGARVPSRGQFCQVTLSVANGGTESRRFAPKHQKIVDGRRDEFSAVAFRAENRPTWQYAGWLVNPGDRFAGTLIFDVSDGFQAEAVELHDAAASRGVHIPVS